MAGIKASLAASLPRRRRDSSSAVGVQTGSEINRIDRQEKARPVAVIRSRFELSAIVGGISFV